MPDGPSSVLWIYDWQRGVRTRLTLGARGQYLSGRGARTDSTVVFRSEPAGGMFCFARRRGRRSPTLSPTANSCNTRGRLPRTAGGWRFSEANAGGGGTPPNPPVGEQGRSATGVGARIISEFAVGQRIPGFLSRRTLARLCVVGIRNSTKCTCGRIRTKVLNGRFRATAARCPSGLPMGASSFIAPKTSRLMVTNYVGEGRLLCRG